VVSELWQVGNIDGEVKDKKLKRGEGFADCFKIHQLFIDSMLE
jgi:hypothetical protein